MYGTCFLTHLKPMTSVPLNQSILDEVRYAQHKTNFALQRKRTFSNSLSYVFLSSTNDQCILFVEIYHAVDSLQKIFRRKELSLTNPNTTFKTLVLVRLLVSNARSVWYIDWRHTFSWEHTGCSCCISFIFPLVNRGWWRKFHYYVYFLWIKIHIISENTEYFFYTM